MIYLVRHAETEWNFQRRKQGLDDSSLTTLGRSQAEGYADSLLSLVSVEQVSQGKVRLFHSPLGRTKTTAQYLIDALQLPADAVIEEPRLIEFDYGRWSGLTNEEIEQQYPGALKHREDDKWNYTVPGGESYADVEKKVLSWLAELDSENINIAVTHSVVSRVIRGCYLDMKNCEAGMLEHPQDTFYRLEDNAGTVIQIDSA